MRQLIHAEKHDNPHASNLLVIDSQFRLQALPLFLDRLLDPVTAVLISITVVLIFGEIIPQAVCTRYGLAVGMSLQPVSGDPRWTMMTPGWIRCSVQVPTPRGLSGCSCWSAG